ncbi:MAG: MlaD family protein [Thermostichales cyanobacterium SZTDM-1c_bins_54]
MGLLIIAGIASFLGLFWWVRNLGGAGTGYRFQIQYPDARGLTPGAMVKLRGVQIGRVQQVIPGPEVVRVEVRIDGKVQIPRQSLFKTTQTGLVGETGIAIMPVTPLPRPIPADLSPLDASCDPELIVCANATIPGIPGSDYAELVTSLNELSQRLNSDELFDNLNQTLSGITETSAKIGQLAETLNRQVGAVRVEDLDLKALSQAGSSAQAAADEFRLLIQQNRSNLDQAVANITALTATLQEIATGIQPLLTDRELQAQVRTTVNNIAIASANVVEITENLQELSQQINDPALVLTLRQTLDSARITFQNAQKITADLDQLTGDAEFRESLKRVVKGLGGLL